MLGDILVTGTRFLNTFFILSTRASVHMVCYYYQECGLHVIIVTINISVGKWTIVGVIGKTESQNDKVYK